MRRKRSGYALVFTLVVIMLIIVLASAVLALTSASFANTISVEKNNKLKLAAESGIERAQLVLKDYLNANPIYISKPDLLVPLNIIVAPLTEDGITTTVTFSPNSTPSLTPDVITGRNIDFINIHSVATGSSGRTKTVDVVLDKRSLSNVYFDRLFKGSFTVAHKDGDTSQNSFTADTNVNLNLSGTMLIQADNFQFQPQIPSNGANNYLPGSFYMDEGDIYKKNNSAMTSNLLPQNSSNNTIHLYKDDGNTNKAGWQNIYIQSVKLLGILDPNSSSSAAPIQLFDNPLNETVDSNFIQTQQFIDTNGNTYPITLITYKARDISSSTNIDFKKLVNGPEDEDYGSDDDSSIHSIYHYILKILRNYPDENVKQHYLDWYGHIYKLLLIDGNLDIDDDSEINYNNYVIYCTGTVTFKGNANFYNSSIFAKSIEFPDSSSGNKNIIFYGVGTNLGMSKKIGNYNLGDFNEWDKDIINTYLENNLDGYGDYMQFKIVSWKEQ